MIGMFGTRRVVDQALAKSKGTGVLDRVALGALFSLLRPNDLVWNYWVRNNLMGDEPPRFDVLAWNSDGTAIPAALHADFLDMFLHNSMARSEMKLLGSPIDLQKVDCDSMVVGARTDHLVPWRASYATTRLLGGTKEFVLSSSGHIQSLVSPPGTPRMTITTGREPVDDPDELARGGERAAGGVVGTLGGVAGAAGRWGAQGPGIARQPRFPPLRAGARPLRAERLTPGARTAPRYRCLPPPGPGPIPMMNDPLNAWMMFDTGPSHSPTPRS